MDIQQRIDELEPISFHNVPVKELAKYCDPFQCWPELESTITKEEVLECLRRGRGVGQNTIGAGVELFGHADGFAVAARKPHQKDCLLCEA